MAQFVPVAACDIVIFGATGDLTRRKLLPALFHRDRDGQLSGDTRIIGVSRSARDDAAFVQLVRDSLERFLKPGELQEEVWARFSQRLSYFAVDVTTDGDWPALAAAVLAPAPRVRVYYLATSPNLFGPTALKLAQFDLVHPHSRIVLEKPLGSDLASARAVNDEVGRVFSEEQIFRIDHYLGKETVQNLLALRFGNSLFEPLWRRGTVNHVQITVAEDIGVGTRGQFYDDVGALKDMVQNHLLQLLCLVAMEAPSSLDHEQIRGEKIKVLQALRPITRAEVATETVRGQYAAGAIDGAAVPGYAQDLEDAGDHDGSGGPSQSETFVAIKAQIDNWRWANVPFYLRTGKRLATKTSQIVIQFNPVAHSIFPEAAGKVEANRLTIRLQPNEGVMLSLMTKQPGPGGFELRSLPLNLSFSDVFELRYPDAYERLLMEVIRGNPALFMRRDEVEAAWQWIDQIRAGWEADSTPLVPYLAGSWGPTEAAMLLDRDGRSWRNNAPGSG